MQPPWPNARRRRCTRPWCRSSPAHGLRPLFRWLYAASAADFLAANADEFQIMNALLKKSGLSGALASDLPNTYFLPPDSAFLLDLGVRPGWGLWVYGMKQPCQHLLAVQW